MGDLSVISGAPAALRDQLAARMYSPPDCMSCLAESDRKALFELLHRILG